MSKIIELKNIKKALNNNLRTPLVIVFEYSTEEEYDFLINKTSDLLAFYLNLEQKINYFSSRHLENTMIRKVLSSESFKEYKYEDRAINFLHNFNFNYQYENIKFQEFKFLCQKNSESNIVFVDNLFLFSRKSLWSYIKNSLLIEKIKQKENNVLQDIRLLMYNLIDFSHFSDFSDWSWNEKTSFKHILTLHNNNNNNNNSKLIIFNDIVLSNSDVYISVNKDVITGEFELILKKSRIKI
jgi:hypothetical protein